MLVLRFCFSCCFLFYHMIQIAVKKEITKMKITSPFSCDLCKAYKKETNNWLLGTVLANGVSVTKWTDAGAKRKGVRHICGVRCAVSFTQEELSKFGTAPSKPAPVIPASPNEAQEQEAIHKAGFSHNAAAPVVDVDISDDKGWNE